MYSIENDLTPVKLGQDGTDDAADNLSANQHKALAALLTHTRIEDAARASDISARTIRRYMADPEFARAYRGQQRILLAETTATLQRIAADAAVAISDSLAGAGLEDKNLRLRAARTALEFLLRAVETERRVIEQDELEERIETLERLL
jgi:hypothetical protein